MLAVFLEAHKRERVVAVRASTRRQHVRNRGEPATARAKAISAARLRAQAAKDQGPEAWAAYLVQKAIELKAKAATYNREHRADKTRTMRELRRKRRLHAFVAAPPVRAEPAGRMTTPAATWRL